MVIPEREGERDREREIERERNNACSIHCLQPTFYNDTHNTMNNNICKNAFGAAVHSILPTVEYEKRERESGVGGKGGEKRELGERG